MVAARASRPSISALGFSDAAPWRSVRASVPPAPDACSEPGCSGGAFPVSGYDMPSVQGDLTGHVGVAELADAPA